ncbi:hypothetical protein PACTADRAFT_48879 [Pachysolen tannophilus NRRL Y-2460]|uniref:Hcy-binding domain-containing protein n=1 Tax=Pachysolen tannophilus NRRL Y-2460 TaxID=669874 RepID=A0A1E4TZF9_PACTA|nr:hypothetical protein PACTADRAFT_48879 [Pachysolen tannophilus NRRL Y-2460]
MTLTIKEILSSSTKPLILDGGLGSEIEDRGYDDDLNDPLWSTIAIINHPDIIKEIQKDFMKNGADIIITCSYQTSAIGLLEHGKHLNIMTENDCIDVFSKSNKISFEAREEFIKENPKLFENNRRIKPLIAGSCGPYGAYKADRSEYTGDYKNVSIEILKDFHYLRLKILLLSDEINFIAFETIPNFEEIKAIVQLFDKLVKDLKLKDKYYSLSLSFKNYNTLADGTKIDEILNYLSSDKVTQSEKEHIIAIGTNCSPLLFSHKTVEYLNKFNNKLHLPIIVYPNSGEVYNKSGRDHSKDPLLDDFVKEAKIEDKNDYNEILRYLTKQWVANGAKIIGGCCRITPANIKCIHDAAIL